MTEPVRHEDTWNRTARDCYPDPYRIMRIQFPIVEGLRGTPRETWPQPDALPTAFEYELREERYGMKSWTTPAMTVAIATSIVTCLQLLPNDAGAEVDTTINNHINTTTIIATEVIEDCQAAPELPATT